MLGNESTAGAPQAQDNDAARAAEVPSEVLASQGSGWTRLLPWLVSIGFVGWLLWPYRVADKRAQLSDAFAQASHWTVLVAVAGAVAMWLTDSYATARTLQRWGTPISLRETTLIRGASALFDAINPALGQAVLTLVVYRRGTPLAQSLLLVLLMNLVFVVHIAVISGVGLFGTGAPGADMMAVLVISSLVSTAVYLAVIALRPAVLARNATLRWLMDAGLSGHAWALVYRLPNVIVVIGAQVLLMRCFGINLPLYVSLFYLPALTFIISIPISAQGLGPAQIAAVSFFSAFVVGDPAKAEATVLAYGFASAALTTLAATAIGICCMTTKTGRDSVAAIRSATRR